MQTLKMRQFNSVLELSKITKKYHFRIKEKCRIDMLLFMRGA